MIFNYIFATLGATIGMFLIFYVLFGDGGLKEGNYKNKK